LRTTRNGPLSPTRVQMLFTTFAVALWYIGQVRTAGNGGLPDVPPNILLALAGSQSTYLIGKGFTMLNWQQYLK
jgi:hypothetical protein